MKFKTNKTADELIVGPNVKFTLEKCPKDKYYADYFFIACVVYINHYCVIKSKNTRIKQQNINKYTCLIHTCTEATGTKQFKTETDKVCTINPELWTYKFPFEVTEEECQWICKEMKNLQCHSIYYHQHSRVCHLVPFTQRQIDMIPRNGFDTTRCNREMNYTYWRLREEEDHGKCSNSVIQ